MIGQGRTIEALDLKLGARVFNKEFLDSFDKKEIGRIACVLNCWKTPKILGVGRPLVKEEIGMIYGMFRDRLDFKSEILPIWNQERHIWKAMETEEPKHYCNACQVYTETVNDTDCAICGLSKSNGNLDEAAQ